MVLHTNSHADLLTLQQAHPSDNISLYTTILGLLQNLAAQGKWVRLSWIPSHVGIQGNDAADGDANPAVRDPVISRYVRPSLQQTKAQTRLTASLHAHQLLPKVGGYQGDGGHELHSVGCRPSL